MSIETIAVTGGNGKIGEAILEHLSECGYHTVNVARGKRREDVADEYWTTDLLDAGEVYSSLAQSDADSVIHMGTIPSPTKHPAHVTFKSNTISTYHILEAACDLGLKSVVLPSSINVMGATYQDVPTDVRYLPVDEKHPVTPRDPYALGKHATEITGDGFGRRLDAPTISSIRFPWVGTTAELRTKLVETDRSLDALNDAWADTARDTLFSYLHIDDSAEIARAAVESNHDGHEAFWAVAPDTTAAGDTAALIDKYYPEAETRQSFTGTEALISTDKAKTLLDWTPELSWRDLKDDSTG